MIQRVLNDSLRLKKQCDEIKKSDFLFILCLSALAHFFRKDYIGFYTHLKKLWLCSLKSPCGKPRGIKPEKIKALLISYKKLEPLFSRL